MRAAPLHRAHPWNHTSVNAPGENPSNQAYRGGFAAGNTQIFRVPQNKLRALRFMANVTGHSTLVLRKLESAVSALAPSKFMNETLATVGLPTLWHIVSQLLIPRRRPAHAHHSHIDGDGRRRAVYTLDTLTPSGARVQLSAQIKCKQVRGKGFSRALPVTRIRLAYRVYGKPGMLAAEVHQEFWIADELAITANLGHLTRLPPPVHVGEPLPKRPVKNPTAPPANELTQPKLAGGNTIFL